MSSRTSSIDASPPDAMTGMRVAVASGAGPAVLSELAVGAAVRSGELVAVPVSGLELVRTLHAVWTDAASLHPAAANLVAIARSSNGP